MRRILTCLVILLVWSTTARSANWDEVIQLQDQTRKAFLAGQFAQLDELIENLERTDARTQIGRPKAGIVYEMLDGTVFLYGAVTNQTLNAHEGQADRWIAEVPTSKSARIVRAMAMKNRAWHARGSGFYPSLSTDQIEAFLVYSRLAKDYLKSVKHLAGSDPHWYALMLDIEIGLSPGETDFDTVANEALAAFPLYTPIYFQIVRKNLSRWGGTKESLEYWVDRIAKAAGSDEAYAKAYWIASDEDYGYFIAGETEANWERFRAGFEIIMKKYPSKWNLNQFARFACAFADKTMAIKLLDQLGTDLDLEAWRSYMRAPSCRIDMEQPDPVHPALEEFILVQAFGRDSHDALVPMVGPVEQPNEDEAVKYARELAEKYEGVKAYKLTPDQKTGSYKQPEELFRHGTIPSWAE